MKLNRKRYLLIVASLLISVVGITSQQKITEWLNTSNLTTEVARHTKFINQLKPERVYISTDRTLYNPGEIVYFSLFNVKTQTLHSSNVSDMIYAELKNPEGKVIQKIKLLMGEKGIAKGDFSFPAEYNGGIYTIVAYTLWQSNDTANLLAEKKVQLQKFTAPNFKYTLEFDRKAYGLNEQVKAEFQLKDNQDKPLANLQVRANLTVDGNEFDSKIITTDKNGKGQITLTIPKDSITDAFMGFGFNYRNRNESFGKIVPLTLENIAMEFYPEGGYLINGVSSQVAFRAINKAKLPADISGIILDESGTEVAKFRSYHDGMGVFSFTPKENKQYSVKITKPSGIAKEYKLPEIVQNGYSLKALVNQKFITLKVYSPTEDNMSLALQLRDSIYFHKDFKVLKGWNELQINTEKYPQGVAQLTLFDNQKLPRSERLVYINKHKNLNIKVSADKPYYGNREKVTLNILTTNEQGIPTPAVMSLSVVEDKLFSYTDDKQGNILAGMYLEPELKIKVNEPYFYYKKDNPKADTALDLLMLTHGWRRYSLETEYRFAQKNNAEKARIGGTVYLNDKIATNKNIEVTARENGTRFITQTNENGKFEFIRIPIQNRIELSAGINNDFSNKVFATVYSTAYRLNIYTQDYLLKKRVENTIRTRLEDISKGGGVGNRPTPNRDEPIAENEEVRNINMAPQQMMMNPIRGVVANEEISKTATRQVARTKEKNQPNRIEIKQVENLMGEKDIEMLEANVLDGKKIAGAPVPDFKRLPQASIYMAREFPTLQYSTSESEQKTDFRKTLHWDGEVVTDKFGKATVSFYTSDENTSFRIITEALGNGLVGYNQELIYAITPIELTYTAPNNLVLGDRFRLPINVTYNKLNSNLPNKLSGDITFEFDSTLEITQKLTPFDFQLNENSPTETFYLELKAAKIGKGELVIILRTDDGKVFKLPYAFEILPIGYPVEISGGAKSAFKTYGFQINQQLDGTMNAKVEFYTSTVDDLLTGIESMLREPHGCFEQTSSSTYPNVLVYELLRNKTNSTDKKTLEKAKNLIDKGNEKLLTFETSTKGYEWFGQAPGHEALSAYGVMQFSDISRVKSNTYQAYNTSHIERTVEFLLARKDNQGGFNLNPKALDQFGRGGKEVSNAYILYSLARSGIVKQSDINKELQTAKEEALKSKDPYRLALVCNTMLLLKDSDAPKFLETLMKLQKEDGSWTSDKENTITNGRGVSYAIEATSLAILSIYEYHKQNSGKLYMELNSQLDKAAKYIFDNRSIGGGFGNTQSTVMALQALVAYQVLAKAPQNAEVKILVDGKVVATEQITQETRGKLTIDIPAKYLKDGKHTIAVSCGDKDAEAFAHSLQINYYSLQPNSSKNAQLRLTTQLIKKQVKESDYVQLRATLTNTEKFAQGMSLAILSIPAGLTLEPKILKELQDNQVFDFYELSNNKLICYYRSMQPKESKTIAINLKAQVPGTFQSDASFAYLYYNALDKYYTEGMKVEIKE